MARKSKARKAAKSAGMKRATTKAKPQTAKATVGSIKDNIARIDALKFKQTPLTAAERKELARLAPRGNSVRWLSEINIGERHRKDMGDLAALAGMIDLAGKLLHPVPIREGDDRLIAGERRVRAWPLTKFAQLPIPVTVVPVKALAKGEVGIRRGEYAENAERKDFTPSEMVAIKRDLEGVLKVEAKARQAHGATAPGKKASGGKKSSKERAAGEVGTIVGAYVGRDRKTIDKAEEVVAAAERNPEKFGKLKDDMDRTGNVSGPHKRLQIMQATDAIRAAPPPLPMNGPYTTMVIDFPWPFEEKDQDEIDAAGRSLRPYPAMSIKAGCKYLAEQVAPLLAPDCSVYFWTTNHHEVRGYADHLLNALGFRAEQRTTMITWVKMKDGKVQIGRGKPFRDATEQCIFVKRGNPVINGLGEDPPSTVIFGERRANSQKPEEFYRMVERVTPASRYASIFSTGGEGELWDCHGDQVGKWAEHAKERGEALEKASAEQRLVDQAAAAKTRTLFDRLVMIEGGQGTMLMGDERVELLHEKLAKGKGRLELTVAGEKKLAQLRLAQFEAELLPALDAIAAGGPLDAFDVAEIKRLKLARGGKQLKLTKLGEQKLDGLREERARQEALASLPDDVEQLVTLYGEALRARHTAIVNNDPALAEMLADRIEVLQVKANGGAEFGMACDDSPAEQLRRRNAATIGDVPVWGQRGMFVIEVDGVRAICEHGDDCDFNLFAVDGDKPFPSETGFKSCLGDFEDPAFGVTVKDQAVAYLTEHIAMQPNRDGSKMVPRKRAISELPASWHRLPTSWDEVYEQGGGAIEAVSRQEQQPATKKRKAVSASEQVRACRACGCTEDKACVVDGAPCHWIEPTLCSACAAAQGHVFTRTRELDGKKKELSVATCSCGFIYSIQMKKGGKHEPHVIKAEREHWQGVVKAARPGDGFRASDVRNAADAPIYQDRHVLVTEASHPHLFEALRIVSHDSGAGASAKQYPVPERCAVVNGNGLMVIDAALGNLSREDLETLCIGEVSEAETIAAPRAELRDARDLLNLFFEGWPKPEVPPAPQPELAGAAE